ncbi:hypothetical protein GVY41_16395 [Frigidibacter albus]|uniref:Glutamine amidotransferase domain-containing protein n=1 Tax=Frigidibacter albus TaxID=1465486 RepID=A0A6L8VNR2_9RHOB|nr:hypothetical protein [Frigidibacter albus]MZQ90800.1 hypothetical protein [Frigidibacter albus]NBE32582.1 hypothetical protein [Frigidibacter albus]GGH61215.1 membrane protein [Frigidibacter albus]
MVQRIVFDALLPWPLIWAAAVLAALMVALALWRGLPGWWLRGLAAVALLAALAGPALETEDRQPLSDIVLMVVDGSASQSLPGRAEQTAAAVARVEAEVAALPNTELRRIDVGDGAEDAGTLLMTALSAALAEEPRARVAGAILISDGQAHDLAAAPDMPAPLTLLQTGRAADWDRRLVVRTAPAFGIIGEPLSVVVRIEEMGAMPAGEAGRDVDVTLAIDGGEPEAYQVPVNTDLELALTLEHGGQNVVQFDLAASEGELTTRNNAAVVQINGVRDRLRVLLVSGEPHAGERTWRNLLKSDASVDLVHFTILRPPEKQDGVPVTELSLIAFPTQELFVEKIDEFDLIIFDRYSQRGILPPSYFDNIRDYVTNGGAVLVSAGPEFASVESVYHSSLAEILPARPTARVLERGFLPTVSELGQRHPVTEGLDEFTPEGADAPERAEGEPAWGRWMRMVDLEDTTGETVMEGADGRPLLVLDRAGEGRIALLASDHAWLWSRGYEGGGPQLELLRRLAHWMMKEPELEEEALTVTAEGQDMTITRRTLGTGPREVTITHPDGTETVLPMRELSPGRHIAEFAAPEIGLYRMQEGDQERVFAVGPSAPREFESTIASAEPLTPAMAPVNGGAVRLEEGMPDIRTVREGRPAAGRGWIGITPREAHATVGLSVAPLLPAWVFLLLASGLILGAWLREGRR